MTGRAGNPESNIHGEYTMSDDCMYAGIDVSKDSLELVIRSSNQVSYLKSFANTKAGIRKVVSLITKPGLPCRVVVEPTSRYHVQVTLALAALPDCQVMLVNPLRARKFQEANGKRAKTDAIDARSLSKMAQKLEEDFIPYTPPADNIRELQLLGRRLANCVLQRARAKCRLKSYPVKDKVSNPCIASLKREIKFYKKEIARLLAKMQRIVDADAELRECYDLLLGIRGIARQSALQLLAELMALPAGMGPRQWVACAGLDPKPQQSGQHDPPMRISKMGNRYLKQVLFMAAMTTTHWDPQIKAYYDNLYNRKNSKRLAQVVVMRRLLHGFWHVIDRKQPFDASKCFAIPTS